MIRVERGTVGPLRVAVAEIPGLRSVASLLALDAGQLAQPRGRAGVARLTAQALLRGTEVRSASQWAEQLDALGASARLDVGGQAALFSGQCLAPDLDEYLALVAEAVLRPALDASEVEFVRKQALAQVEEDKKDTRAVADAAWRELAYPPEHPFRTRAVGEEAVVRSATADELRRFHADRILGGGGLLVLAGGIGCQEAIEAAAAAFRAWPDGNGRAYVSPPDPALSTVARREIVVPDKTQCDVVLGWHGLARRDPRYVAARVTNMVFAADTFASRAGNVVRDQLGLAYYVFSTLGAARVAAPWLLRMGVNPDNVRRAVDTTFAELRKIHDGAIAEDDFTMAKDKLIGELEVALESPGGLAQLILEAELFELGDDHFERYPRELRGVTLEQVIATAREFLTLDRYALAIAGPRIA